MRNDRKKLKIRLDSLVKQVGTRDLHFILVPTTATTVLQNMGYGRFYS